ncbi:hypothetical protein NL676_022807 [Syzygium grande]|nr:hypothetical protein NL676_022807 [Syzygium grande]
MARRAYDLFHFLTDCPAKIEAVESYASEIFLGCSDGSLRVYGPRPSRLVCLPPPRRRSDPSPPPPPDSRPEHRMVPYVLRRNVDGFAKRPFLSMEVLASRELLLTLSESIAFHRLPDLKTVAVLTEARGANACSWDDKRGFLCFARQMSVFIFRYDGGSSFVEVKEFGVPDTVEAMSWCGENICLAIRREYVIMNATDGALSEVSPCGRVTPPLVVPLPSGELILGKDNVGVFVDRTGKLLPEAIPKISSYRNILHVGALQIRALRVPYPLIQTVFLGNVRHLAQSSSAIVGAQDNSVCGFFPVPFGSQLVQLMESGNFEEALVLCKSLPPEDSSKEGIIHMSYADHLFETGSYDDAMDHFLASKVNVTYVLSLYPSIILPQMASVPEPQKLMDNSPEFDEHSAVEPKQMSHIALLALIKFLQKKRCSIIEKATTEGTEEVVLDAVGDGNPSYDINRFERTNKRRATIAISSIERYRVTILDTALLQALLLTGQSSAAVEFLKGLNYCHVTICEEILQNSSHCTALLELYKSNSMHRQALELLHHLVEESKSNESKDGPTQKFQPEMIIEYLKPLCGTDPMLVLDFGMLVLESCPAQTIELFRSGNLPKDLVCYRLEQHASNRLRKEKARRRTPAAR